MKKTQKAKRIEWRQRTEDLYDALKDRAADYLGDAAEQMEADVAEIFADHGHDEADLAQFTPEEIKRVLGEALVLEASCQADELGFIHSVSEVAPKKRKVA